jgi:hypothetical protein
MLEHSDDASLVGVGRGVAVIEFHSKMNSWQGAVAMMPRARPCRADGWRTGDRQRGSARVHGNADLSPAPVIKPG